MPVNGAPKFHNQEPQDFMEPMNAAAAELLSLDQEINKISSAIQSKQKKNGAAGRGPPKLPGANGANGSTTPKKRRGGATKPRIKDEMGDDVS